MKRTYETEFPDFGEMDVIPPEGFVDFSWHNDTMPSFGRELPNGNTVRIWVDYFERGKREAGENASRFAVVLYDNSSIMVQPLIESNDWAEIIKVAKQASK